jgi:hypothetical protein
VTNGPIKILTSEDCTKRIDELANKLEEMAQSDNCTDHEFDIEVAKVEIWERVRYHIDNGQIVTLDTEERLHLWPVTPRI